MKTTRHIGKRPYFVRASDKWYNMLEYRDLGKLNRESLKQSKGTKMWGEFEYQMRITQMAMTIQDMAGRDNALVTRTETGKPVVWVKYKNCTFIVGWSPKHRKVGVYCFEKEKQVLDLIGVGGACAWIRQMSSR